MSSRTTLITPFMLAALVIAGPAIARKQGKALDPNRMICRESEVIGSRLQTKKTCLRAMQWDQLQREQRETIDRVQAYKPNQG